MSYLHDDLDNEVQPPTGHRELTLSTGSILAIFCGLSLLCALFFGFGYNMGSRSHQAPVATTTTPAGSTDFSSFKPSPGTPAGTPAPAYTASKTPELPPPATSASSSGQPAPIVRTAPPPASPASLPARATEPAPAAATPAPRASSPASEAGITFIVQVAAVSHQEDAELLVAALKRKGYAVNARTEPQDKLFHIQVGPFASRHDADTMRQRLQGDGYNAIVK